MTSRIIKFRAWDGRRMLTSKYFGVSFTGEFYAAQKEERLRNEYRSIFAQAEEAHEFVKWKETRKEQAQWLLANAKKVSGIVFSMLDHDVDKVVAQIWKMVRPHGAKPFKLDTDA